MAKDITLMGKDYYEAQGISVPKTEGGRAVYYDVSETDAAPGDVLVGKTFVDSSGQLRTGTLPEGGGGSCQNWVDGQATGSVRTVTAAEEGPDYSLGTGAVAEGNSTKASGMYSHAEGAETRASGDYSHAEGVGSWATGLHSHAEGGETRASAMDAHSEGSQAEASGVAAHAEGGETTASGQCAHAEGSQTVASGDYSHAEGLGTIASGTSQHVVGQYNETDDETTYLEIVGNGSRTRNPMTGGWIILRSNARTLDGLGNETLAGKLTVGAGPENAMDAATKQYVDAHSGGGGVLRCARQVVDNVVTIDKTYEEIDAAIRAGQIVIYYDDTFDPEPAPSLIDFMRLARATYDEDGFYVTFRGGEDTVKLSFSAADPFTDMELYEEIPRADSTGGLFLIEENGNALSASYNDILNAIDAGLVPVLRTKTAANDRYWFYYVTLMSSDSVSQIGRYKVHFSTYMSGTGPEEGMWEADSPDDPLEARIL